MLPTQPKQTPSNTRQLIVMTSQGPRALCSQEANLIQNLYLEQLRAIHHFQKTLIDFSANLLATFTSLQPAKNGASKKSGIELAFLAEARQQLQQCEENIAQFNQAIKKNNNFNTRMFNNISSCRDKSIQAYQALYKQINQLLADASKQLNYQPLKNLLARLNGFLQKAASILQTVQPNLIQWQKNYQTVDRQFRQTWAQLNGVILASRLERIRAEQHFQGAMLQWLSNLINNIPYWLPEDVKSQLQHYNNILTADIKAYQALVKQAEKTIDHQLIQQTNKLSQNISLKQDSLYTLFDSSFMLMYRQLRDNIALHDCCKNCIVALQHANELFKTIQLGDSGENTWKINYQNQHKQCAENFQALFEEVVTLKTALFEKTTLSMMQHEKDFIKKYKIKQSDFRWGKYLQHCIYAHEQLICQPDNILAYKKPRTIFGNEWIEKSKYSDLLLLLETVQPQFLEQCLDNKINIYKTLLKELHKQAKTLHEHWGEATHDLVRIKRIIGIYALWQKGLSSALAKMDIEDKPSWSTLSTIYRLFSYEKKAFFTKTMEQENAIPLLLSLMNLLQQEPDLKNPQTAKLYLNKQKQAIKDTLEQQKNDLTKNHAFWEKTLVFLELAISQQPTFQVATAFNDVGMDGLTYLEENTAQGQQTKQWIDDIGGRIIPNWIKTRLNPERDMKIMRYTSGLMSFCIDQYFASWMGNTYRTFSAINRIFLSQFDLWMKMGEKLQAIIQPMTDALNYLTPTQFNSISRALIYHCQTDEIAFLEKQAAMSWIFGLGLNLIMSQGKHIIPATMAYTAATSITYGSSLVIDEVFANKEYNPKAIALGKYAVHAGIYGYAYSAGFKKGHQWFSAQQQDAGITQEEALSILGFNNRPTATALRKRYQDLGRQHHPDKCKSKCINSSSTFFASLQMSEAKEICYSEDQLFREFFQPKFANHMTECVTQCEIDSHEKMSSINAAYNILK